MRNVTPVIDYESFVHEARKRKVQIVPKVPLPTEVKNSNGVRNFEIRMKIMSCPIILSNLYKLSNILTETQFCTFIAPFHTHLYIYIMFT